MKKNRKLIVASLLIVALIVAGVVSVLSQTGVSRYYGRHHADCLDQLTEEQQEVLSQKIEELKESGATHEEIREAVQQLLEEWGIDTECFGMMPGFGRGPPGQGCLDQLTEEQQELLSQKIEELKESGATHEEIREAVQQLLEEWGIDTEGCHGTMGPERGQHGG